MSVTNVTKVVLVNAIINSNDIDNENENVPIRDRDVVNISNSSNNANSVESIQTSDEPAPIIVTESDENNHSNSSNERRRSMTTSSTDSNKVSIKSINENDISSNYSDSDAENVIDNYNDNNSRTDIYATSIGLVPANKIIDPNNISNSNILCAKDANERPNIGSIAMQNCNDVTFGDKTYISGNLIVKQFIQSDEQNTWKERAYDNSAFAGSADKFDQNQNGFFESKVHPDEIEKKWKWTSKQALMIALVAGICLFVPTAMILILKFSSGPGSSSKSPNKIGDGEDSRLNKPIKSTIGSDIMFPSNSSIRFVSRDEWIAQPPSARLTDLELPAKRVIIAHTATENCSTQAECTFRVRFIQTFHIESRGWSDIGYNFLVGGDGAIYEGRGWTKEGAHTKGFNKKSICFAFIGTFNTALPPPHQLEVTKRMIVGGVELGVLDKNYKLYGHRQLVAFESPGATLYEEIKTWDHWSEVVEP